ncbi:MAG: hypothetical protein K0R61_5215 [Microvirga sp.]|jgi:hypothetical protein|nr:hypothetical protein [Microvirga sp.]
MASPAFLSVFWSMRRRPIISAPRTSCASEPKQIEGVETRRGLFIAEQVVKVLAVLLGSVPPPHQRAGLESASGPQQSGP